MLGVVSLESVLHSLTDMDYCLADMRQVYTVDEQMR